MTIDAPGDTVEYFRERDSSKIHRVHIVEPVMTFTFGGDIANIRYRVVAKCHQGFWVDLAEALPYPYDEDMCESCREAR